LASQYDNARPVLAQNGIPATYYLVSGLLNASGYMSAAQARQLQGAGSELGSHSATHANLTQISGDQLTNELAGSKSALEAQFGPIRSLAYPFGAYNSAVVAEATRIYETARTTDGGVNLRGAINRGQLTMRYVTNTTYAATVAGWMTEAANAGGWTILVYHGVAEGGDTYSVTPSQFASHMAAVKNSGLRTVTVSAGYDAMT
jgi:peptidoglycan/xylan/chitin deacetylase (PgdA/CDA1 family)